MIRRAILMATLCSMALVSPLWADDVRPSAASAGQIIVFGTNELLRATWMAILADSGGQRSLVRAGEPVFCPGDHSPIATVRDVTREALTLDLTDGGTSVRLTVGKAVPGGKGLVFREAVLVKAIEYRSRTVPQGTPKVLDGELYLAGVQGTRVILQRDVGPALSPMGRLERHLATMRLVETEPRVWEVSARDLAVALSAAPSILPEALAGTRVDLSGHDGIALDVKTPIAEAKIDRRGFLITDPSLAVRAGLQVGDRIVAVNGVSIDGYTSLVQAYLGVRNSPSIRAVELVLERNQQPVSLTYRVR